jgi:3-hydroxyacyl-[acyl-carrier-protein] dehydratase
MLINNFFTPIQLPANIDELKEDQKVEFIVGIKLNPDHIIFKGHFPGQPIVPGVTYIEMIREIMEVVIKKKLYLKEASNIKFLAITNPLENSVLDFTFLLNLKNDKSIVSKVSISSERGVVIKFDGQFYS